MIRSELASVAHGRSSVGATVVRRANFCLQHYTFQYSVLDHSRHGQTSNVCRPVCPAHVDLSTVDDMGNMLRCCLLPLMYCWRCFYFLVLQQCCLSWRLIRSTWVFGAPLFAATTDACFLPGCTGLLAAF